MKKYTFLLIVLFLGLSISSFAQTKKDLCQDKIKNTTITNTSIANSQTISDSIQIKPYRFSPISLDGPRIIVIDGKVSEHGFDGIEPKDIHTVSVVKSERIRSLYGNKDASGVIIITTKRGANETKVENELNKK